MIHHKSEPSLEEVVSGPPSRSSSTKAAIIDICCKDRVWEWEVGSRELEGLKFWKLCDT